MFLVDCPDGFQHSEAFVADNELHTIQAATIDRFDMS
jgi:hypothetical protein